MDRGRGLISPIGLASVRETFSGFLAPLEGQNRGIACPLVLARPLPLSARWGVPPFRRGRDVRLGCGPKRHLAHAPRSATSRSLWGASLGCTRPLPTPILGGSRQLTIGAFPAYLPSHGLRFAGLGTVSSRPTLAKGGVPCEWVRPPPPPEGLAVRCPPGASTARGLPDAR